MTALVKAQTGRILGAAVLGLEGGEGGVGPPDGDYGSLPYTALCDDLFRHPTLTESLNNLFGTLDRAVSGAEVPRCLGRGPLQTEDLVDRWRRGWLSMLRRAYRCRR